MLQVAPANVIITKAASVATLSAGLVAHVATTTAGVPGGSVSLAEGGAAVQTVPLNASGDAVFAQAGLSAGSHTLQAVYGGDANFSGSLSGPVLVTTGPGAAADFVLAANGPATVQVPAGSAAQFSFAMTPTGVLNSPVQLSVTGVPAGATASFNPAYLPPGGGAQRFVLTVSTPRASLASKKLLWFAVLLPLVFVRRVRRYGLVSVVLLAGCGDRVGNFQGQGVVRSYTLVVTGTATGVGGVLVHSAAVTLEVN